MRLFRKNRTPEDVGRMLYEALRRGMESAKSLSVVGLLESLDADPDALDEQYLGEIAVGLMFGSAMAAERSSPPRVAEQIVAGMKTEFLQHVREQGASALQRAEWENVVAARFLAYRQELEGYSGFEPPWKVGRRFYWNLLGREENSAMCVKIATLYLLEGRDACQSVLNEHGPSILVNRGGRTA
jgi:hypothetical protein